MAKAQIPADTRVITRAATAVLRDRLPSDVDAYVRWMTAGEWRLFDAPWEGLVDSLSPDLVEVVRARFLDACAAERPSLRNYAIIAGVDDRPLGWLVAYSQEHRPDALWVGIDICEDAALNRGLGSVALGLWVDYLFAHSYMHRIGLDTWSFNPRMQRVAEKLGFACEGVRREMITWQGVWLDLLHYGLLRREWERRRGQATRLARDSGL